MLTDVAAGLVTLDVNGFIGIPDTVDVADGQAYRLVVVTAVTRSQVMVPPGQRVLVLSTIGEHLRRKGNPNAYRSPRAFDMRDGKLGTAAVAR
ncbi:MULTISPECIES: hypothetical protein [unclassified Micromonospora]|uniref:hypothetical protein n=1 Tax=unclassified Micromonospora TaxID=2617518 RepID=UPI003316FDE7